MSEEIWLKANKKKYGGWKSVEVSKSIGSICGTFRCSYAERYTRKAGKKGGLKRKVLWDLDIGDAVEILCGEETVLRGTAERFSNSYSPSSHAISVQGRSYLADLVDCSKAWGGNEYNNIDIVRMCEELMWAWNDQRPRLFVETSTRLPANLFDPFPKITIQQGDTLFSVISKMCKQRGVIPLSYGDETLILTTPGDAESDDALISGVPVKAYWREVGHTIQNGTVVEDNVNRFREYIVKGQAGSHDPVNSPGGLSAVTAPFGYAWDYGIVRVKPTVLIMEDPADSATCKKRAEWESMNRAGKSRKYAYTIRGWAQRNGRPWQPNMLVQVKDEIGGVDGKYLIDSVSHKFSEQTGTRSTLTLVHPDSYEMPDDIDKKPENITGTFDPLTPEE